MASYLYGVALWCFLLSSFAPTEALDCFKCAGMKATQNGLENANTAAIIAIIDGQTPGIIGMNLEVDCLSHDRDTINGLQNETCEAGEVCGYLNMTLDNPNYSGFHLVLSGVIRQCQPPGAEPCYTGSGAGLSSDTSVTALLETLSTIYGTGDHDNEPQEVFGCHCSSDDTCNLEYDPSDTITTPSGSSSSSSSDTTDETGSSGATANWGTPLLYLMTMVVALRKYKM